MPNNQELAETGLNLESVKKMSVSKFQILFKTRIDGDDDFIKLVVSLSPEFVTFLKDASLRVTSGYDFNNGDTREPRQRYKVRSWAYNSMNSDWRDVLFDKTLLDEGKVELKFSKCNFMENCMNDIKVNMRKLLDQVTKFANIKQTVTYEIQEPKSAE